MNNQREIKEKLYENWNVELPEELKQRLAEIVVGIIIDFQQKWKKEILEEIKKCPK